jgi:sulfite oxidase
MVVPGHIGARNVKWVNSIRLSSEEAVSVWQRGVQYKGFSSNIKKFDKAIDPSTRLSCQEMPVSNSKRRERASRNGSTVVIVKVIFMT